MAGDHETRMWVTGYIILVSFIGHAYVWGAFLADSVDATLASL